MRKVGLYTKSSRGQFDCVRCADQIVAKQKYYEWTLGGQFVRCHEFHGSHTACDLLTYTDGGKQAAGFNEYKDCTVRALACALDLPYDEAHEYLRLKGRKDRKGFHCQPVFNTYNRNGKMLVGDSPKIRFKWDDAINKMRRITISGPASVGQFIAQADSSKRYIVLVNGHAFAVVGGKIMDSFDVQLRRRVKKFWEVKEAA
jgi:hypothetical protein